MAHGCHADRVCMMAARILAAMWYYSGHDIGVIAQDVEKVLPEAVSTKPDGTKGVHYNKLLPLLIEAVKDLSQQVDDIKDK